MAFAILGWFWCARVLILGGVSCLGRLLFAGDFCGVDLVLTTVWVVCCDLDFASGWWHLN